MFCSRSFVSLMTACIAVFGCAQNIDPDPGPDAGPITALVTFETEGDVTTASVNASDYDQWVYLDLDTSAEVEPETPSDHPVWDLRLQRFKIQTNGGVSGTGGVAVARVRGGDFDAMTEAPNLLYAEDAMDSDDEDNEPDNPFIGDAPWYDYDQSDHTLSPADFVYVVRSTEGTYYKLQMINYYNGAGTSGYPRFRYGVIDPPTGDPALADRLVVEGSERDEWVYIDVLDRAVIEVADPATSDDWDLAVNGRRLRTNSGTSGTGLGGAKLGDPSTWDGLTVTDTVGFVVDEQPDEESESLNSLLSDWFDGDEGTQTIPKDQVYALRTADGDYAKVQVIDYSEGELILRLDRLTRELAVHQNVLNNVDSEQWVHFDFETGSVVTPDDPQTDTVWDIAVSGSYLRTNSGTSGIGLGGAYDPELATLDEVRRVPAGQGCYLPTQGHVCDCEMSEELCNGRQGVWTEACGCPAAFVVDEQLPVAQGGGETYSGNAALSGWFDPDSEPYTPKDSAYLVRSGSGAYAKFKITDASASSMTFDWTYAGPGTTRF